jgi:hypothetical protein
LPKPLHFLTSDDQWCLGNLEYDSQTRARPEEIFGAILKSVEENDDLKLQLPPAAEVPTQASAMASLKTPGKGSAKQSVLEVSCGDSGGFVTMNPKLNSTSASGLAVKTPKIDNRSPCGHGLKNCIIQYIQDPEKSPWERIVLMSMAVTETLKEDKSLARDLAQLGTTTVDSAVAYILNVLSVYLNQESVDELRESIQELQHNVQNMVAGVFPMPVSAKVTVPICESIPDDASASTSDTVITGDDPDTDFIHASFHTMHLDEGASNATFELNQQLHAAQGPQNRLGKKNRMLSKVPYITSLVILWIGFCTMMSQHTQIGMIHRLSK